MSAEIRIEVQRDCLKSQWMLYGDAFASQSSFGKLSLVVKLLCPLIITHRIYI